MKKLSHPPQKASSSPAIYLRWLALLCAIMALFCLGVFIVGYKDPSFGRVATFVLLCIACPALMLIAKRLDSKE
ncbi:hypothetical protein AALA21_04655 [Eggerthellaceae bacterium 3-80]|nr:hypothetical protein D7W09_03295 [bacterium D16-34]